MYDAQAASERRPMRVSLGVHYDGASYPQPDVDDALNGIAAVCARVGRNLPKCDKTALKRFGEFVDRWLLKNMKPLAADTDVSFETWINGTNYNSAIREKFRRINTEFECGYCLKKGDCACKCFLKMESYPAFKNPRGIFSRSDRFKCRVGPYFKLIEKELMKMDYFIKKIPVSERPAYLKERFGHIEGVIGRDSEELMRVLGTDYTAYESSFRSEFMEMCEMKLYRYLVQLLPDAKEFISLIEGKLLGTNVCYFKKFRAMIDASRMSG